MIAALREEELEELEEAKKFEGVDTEYLTDTSGISIADADTYVHVHLP